MDSTFYDKFPCCFKEALISGKVIFSKEPIIDFATFYAYRGIFREKGRSFSDIAYTDFLSYAEQGRPYRPFLGSKDRYYSCSMYENFDECAAALKFPNEKEDRAIAKGPVTKENGCIQRNGKDSHVDWWIYSQHSLFWEQYKQVDNDE